MTKPDETRYSREELEAAANRVDWINLFADDHIVATVGATLAEADRMREAATDPIVEYDKCQKHHSTYQKRKMNFCPNCGFNFTTAPPEGTWVQPGDGVQFGEDSLQKPYGIAKRGVVCQQRGAALDNDWLPIFHDGRFNFYGDGAPNGPAPTNLRTLSGRPVLGVRVGEFTEEEVREAMHKIVAAWTTPRLPGLSSHDGILREIREARP